MSVDLAFGVWIGVYAGALAVVAFAAGRGFMEKDTAFRTGLILIVWPVWIVLGVISLPFVGIYWLAKRTRKPS
jgi:hypothetical protein